MARTTVLHIRVPLSVAARARLLAKQDQRWLSTYLALFLEQNLPDPETKKEPE